MKNFFIHVRTLNPYCFNFRYPPDNDDLLMPDREDVYTAIRLAEEIYNFVVKKVEVGK